MALEEVVAATHNHPSFWGNHREATPPGLQQALETEKKGYALLFTTREAAEQVCGAPAIPPR